MYSGQRGPLLSSTGQNECYCGGGGSGSLCGGEGRGGISSTFIC